MSLLNHKISFIQYIKTSMLPYFGYTENIELETPETVDLRTHEYRLAHGDIVYCDQNEIVKPSGIAMYDNGRRLELSEYSINCIDGSLKLNIVPSGELRCSYSRYTVNVIDSFPDSEELATMELPFVCVDMTEQESRPFAINSREDYWDMAYYIDIFASSDPMRIQLMDRIQRGIMTWIPIIDFEQCMPLNFDGTINASFDRDSQFMYMLKMRSRPRGKSLNTDSVSPKEKYRAVIAGFLTSIK